MRRYEGLYFNEKDENRRIYFMKIAGNACDFNL